MTRVQESGNKLSILLFITIFFPFISLLFFFPFKDILVGNYGGFIGGQKPNAILNRTFNYIDNEMITCLIMNKGYSEDQITLYKIWEKENIIYCTIFNVKC